MQGRNKVTENQKNRNLPHLQLAMQQQLKKSTKFCGGKKNNKPRLNYFGNT